MVQHVVLFYLKSLQWFRHLRERHQINFLYPSTFEASNRLELVLLAETCRFALLEIPNRGKLSSDRDIWGRMWYVSG